ncbi:Transglutaminase-like superfamily protein [Planctomycetes bacterium K2D]|uniref:Transglutaminase-like superfamily protein n=2 Tax=Botrimarina mediterranea TaxID=2528022 RepID=A0A518KBL6_9BACT|nr:Transglutaminase-like superfamily protein [Botrimarina mediterranea]QDV79805.1 Transglutaminase-like superfamily protein [Planctomycetes bacterium K2D]
MRHSARIADRTALEDSRWRLTYDVKFKATGSRTEVRLALPLGSDHIRIEEENATNPKLTEDTRRLVPSGTRELVVATNQLGDYQVTSEFVLRLRPRGGFGETPLAGLSGDVRARYTAEVRTIFPTRNSDVQALLNQAKEVSGESRGAILQWIFEHCSRDLKPAPANANDTVLGALRDQTATPLGRARLMVTLCRAADFPARLVTGFELRQQDQLTPHTWVEVFSEGVWLPFDPVYGHARRMPNEFVAARRDGEQIVRTPRAAMAEAIETKYSIVRLGPSNAVINRAKPRPSQVFNLTRLPVEMHEVLKLLLLLPFGALITAFFRNIVGIPTFGTFAPALFAVSFIYADWGSGLMILAVVFAAGLIGRAIVGRLQLLMVPRLSIILTVIILCVVFGVSALDYLNLTPSANAVLLPLVIVTVLIERFYVTTEEDGIGYSLQLIAGTIAVGAVCFTILSWKEVGDLILVYPEIHLITVALFIAIGRYAGYRIVELWRFRDLVKAQDA